MDESRKMVITVPWPPSVNHYWRRFRDRFYITKEGIYYRVEVTKLAKSYKGFFNEDDSIKVEIKAFPPDRRRRDLDNVLKCLLDSLQHAEVYNDDSQIDDLHITRYVPNIGQLIVTLNAIK